MHAILALAAKDLLVLRRIRAAWFFTFVWPVLIATFFGLIFSGSNGETGRVGLVVVDEDSTDNSRRFVDRLAARPELDVTRAPREEALGLVRRGRRTAALVLPAGFGEATGRLFYGTPPTAELWADPSRKAESGLLQGLLFQEAAESLQTVMNDRAASQRMIADAQRSLATSGAQDAESLALRQFLGELDRFLGREQPTPATPASATPWQPLAVEAKAIARDEDGPRSGFDVTFPQAIMWGVIGCVMTFAISLVSERTKGTLMRLEAAPISRADILGGKALACIAAILVMEMAMMTLGRVAFGVRPQSIGLLALAGASTAIGFVGIMMLVSSFGRTEQAASGAGWATLMPMAMLGGAMVPLFVMPSWMATLSYVSPIRWAILAFEGAIWRGFSLNDMLVPCTLLLGIGVVCFAIGTRTLKVGG